MQLGLNIVAVGQSLVRRDIRATADPRFRAVVQRVRAADLAFTNFEGTIAGAHGGWPTKPSHFGAADPMVLDVLAELGFSALSLANNHAFDLGPGGVLSTLEEVGRRGFLSAGLGVDATAAGRGCATCRRGGWAWWPSMPGRWPSRRRPWTPPHRFRRARG
jgi:poly-gamma-glutamate synthesis protein (capsule biosynthesis protein)